MRIGINIPNDLVERYKPLKGTYNLSQLCRNAIKSSIEAYERAVNQAESDGMQAVADKLWLEYLKKTPTLDWEAIGRDDAKVWVHLATLQDLKDLFHDIGVHKRKGLEPGQFLARIIPGAKWFEDHYGEHKDWFSCQMELSESSNPHIWAETEYCRGWISYVTAVWQMVEERIAANTTAIEKTFKEARQKSIEESFKDGEAKAEILAKQ